MLQEGFYNPKEVYKKIDKPFIHYNILKEIKEDGTIIYSSIDSNQFWIFGKVIMELCEHDWFMNYTSKWIWKNDHERGQVFLSEEDALLYFGNRKSL